MTAKGNMSGVGMLSQRDVFWPSRIFLLFPPLDKSRALWEPTANVFIILYTKILNWIQEKCWRLMCWSFFFFFGFYFLFLSTQTRCGGPQDALRCHRWAPLTLMDKHFVGLNAVHMFSTGVYLICVIAELCYKIWMRRSAVTRALFPTFAERCFASDKIFMGEKSSFLGHTLALLRLSFIFSLPNCGESLLIIDPQVPITLFQWSLNERSHWRFRIKATFQAPSFMLTSCLILKCKDLTFCLLCFFFLTFGDKTPAVIAFLSWNESFQFLCCRAARLPLNKP